MTWPASRGLPLSVRAVVVGARGATSTSSTASMMMMMTTRARAGGGGVQRGDGPLPSVTTTTGTGTQPRRCKHTQWMQRHLRDPYVRASKKENLRSRAAFKLKEMQEKHRIIRPGDSVVDLGCAPGGWSEVAVGLVGASTSTSSNSSSRTQQASLPSQPPPSRQQQQQWAGRKESDKRPRGREGRVVGVDLLPVRPLAGATLLQGDFTDPRAKAGLLEHLRFIVHVPPPLPTPPSSSSSSVNGAGDLSNSNSGSSSSRSSDDQGRRVIRVDVVLSDMAPHFSGDSFVDHRRCLDLCYEVFAFADEVFAPPSSSSTGGGTVLCKFFKGRDEAEFLAHVRARYREVKLLKPKASRSESSETYVLARGHKGLPRRDDEEEEDG